MTRSAPELAFEIDAAIDELFAHGALWRGRLVATAMLIFEKKVARIERWH